MDCGRNRILRVGKNSGPILSRLWTKVYKIFGQYREPLELSNVLARLSILHVSFRRYSPLSLEIVENTEQM